MTFSDEIAAHDREMKAFLSRNLYRSEAVMTVMSDAEAIVRDLFRVYLDDPREMPEGWRDSLGDVTEAELARHAADFLAGMTDTYALKEHRRLFDHTPELG